MKAPIFIVGLNKSGTSLLNTVLANHAQTSGLRAAPGEAKNGSAKLYLSNFGLIEGHKIEGLPDKLRFHQESHLFAHPRNFASYRLTEADVEPGDRESVASVYTANMIDPTKRLVEKSPPNILRTRYLQALFPDATFICVLRDPRANIAANAKKRTKWGTVEEQAAHWTIAYRTLLDDMSALDGSCLIVRYEQLTTDLGMTLPLILRFCGLDGIGALRPVVPIETNMNAELIPLLSREETETVRQICGPVADQIDAWD